jgi:hypothetical protein
MFAPRHLLTASLALCLLSADGRAATPKPKPKPHSFEGMIVLISGAGDGVAVDIKHKDGVIKTFHVNGKTKVGGQGVNNFSGLRKGQIVKVHYSGPHAGKIDVNKKPAPNPNLTGKPATFSGTVTHVDADHYGDNGHLEVKDAKGVTKKFVVHNETLIDYKRDGATITHTLQGVGKGMKVNVKSVGKDAVHIDVIIKPGTFHGMVVKVAGTDGAASITIKHANGTGRTYHIDGKTQYAGLGVTAFPGLRKGQIVKVAHFGKHATTVHVEKQAAANPKLAGKTATFSGTVTHVDADKYGDNGHIEVKDAKGVTKKFVVHNETNIDYKQNGKTIIHTLQGVHDGMHVHIKSVGVDAVHIDVVMSGG